MIHTITMGCQVHGRPEIRASRITCELHKDRDTWRIRRILRADWRAESGEVICPAYDDNPLWADIEIAIQDRLERSRS